MDQQIVNKDDQLYLLVLYGLSNDLSVEMIVKTMIKMRLYGERFVQELLEEILL